MKVDEAVVRMVNICFETVRPVKFLENTVETSDSSQLESLNRTKEFEVQKLIYIFNCQQCLFTCI